jgi:CelD/BcsL family acetyltransferase involved in cellulose biosynthesis
MRPLLASVHNRSNLRVDRLTSVDDLDRIRDEWDQFVEHVGSDIYFTVDWLQAWWAHYARKRTFCGLVMRDGTRMVAAFPFCIERVWAGPVPVRLARLVGADSTLPVFVPAVAKGFEEQTVNAALEVLFDGTGCDAVSLAPLSGLSPVAVAAERIATDGRFKLLRSDSRGPHSVFNLPASFEGYLQSLSTSQRQTHRRYLRKLKNDRQLSFRTISGEEAISYFDRFVKLHTAHWKPRAKLGHFGDWPASIEFNRDLISRMAGTRRARFYEIADGDDVLAIEYCFLLGDRCYWRLPARNPDPELEKVRLGRLSLTEMFRVLIEDGRTVVEAGPGHYEYKRRLGAEEHLLRRVVVARQSGMRYWRGALLMRWASAVHLIYYRGWFLKLRPRLGLPPRPLWRTWVRTRI